MRQRVVDRVHAHLVELVSSGRVGPGERLPPERTLADDLGVSRPAVREAVQRLAAAGVVEVRQGDGTRVIGAREDGADREPMPGSTRELLETRRVLLTGAAGIAARVADQTGVDRLGQAVGDVTAATTADQQCRAVARVWERVLDMADNTALRAAVDLVTASLHEATATTDTIVLSPRHGELLVAVATGRETAAREVADALLDDENRRALAAIETP